MPKTLAAIAAALFLACILLANYVTTELGMVSVGFGLTATAGTYFAGLTFVLRDFVQDQIRVGLTYRYERTVYVPVIPGHPGGGYRSAIQPVKVVPRDRVVAGLTLVPIALGAVLSYALAVTAFEADPAFLPPGVTPISIAVASSIAFGCAELLDLCVYTPLRRRGYIRAALASNVVGAVVDTFLFLWIAGFPIAAAWQGQVVGKLTITGIAIALVWAVRAARGRSAVSA